MAPKSVDSFTHLIYMPIMSAQHTSTLAVSRPEQLDTARTNNSLVLCIRLGCAGTRVDALCGMVGNGLDQPLI
jgi:hypothetical protein